MLVVVLAKLVCALLLIHLMPRTLRILLTLKLFGSDEEFGLATTTV